MQEQDFDQLTQLVYRAAAGEVPWGDALEQMRLTVRAWVVHLMGVRTSDGVVAFSYEVGDCPPEAFVQLARYYHRIDPRAGLVISQPAGTWVNCHEHFDEAFVARDPFYQDFLIPYGGRYCSGTKLFHDDELVVILGIHRGRGMQPLNAAEAALGQRFAEHLRTAVGLWRRQRKWLQEGLTGNALLARLSQPMLLLDEQLQMHFRNASAQHLLATDDRLADRAGMLSLPHTGETDLLMALRRLRLGGASSYREAVPQAERAVVRVDAGSGRVPLLLILLPLRPSETMGAFGPRALAMVLIHDLSQRNKADPFVVAAAFDMTPAEARVATRLAGGESPQRIADDHRVAISTVRSQMRTVFDKVGVNRQADLVAALAAIPAIG